MMELSLNELRLVAEALGLMESESLDSPESAALLARVREVIAWRDSWE